MMEWTSDQLKAIETHGTNIIVSAGAGSGKTAVLTERTIRNLKNFKIDKMIVLTFTNAAAFSMKSKIKKAIIKSKDKSLEENLKLIESATICTFDSFSLNLVKKYSHLLNVDPDIGITDEVVIASARKRITDEVFLEFYNNQKFLDFIDTYTVKKDDSIKADVEVILKELDKIYDPIKYLDDYFNKFDALKKEEFIKEYKSLIDNMYLRLKENYDELLSLVSSDKEEAFVNTISSYMNFSTIEDYSLFWHYSARIPAKANEEFKAKYAEFKNTIREIKALAIYRSEDEIKAELEEASKHHLVLVELLKTIISRLNSYKKENNYYEFKDIMRLAIRVLEENEDICNYYKENIKEIMIDEYQDTNDLAEYLVSLIANNNLFMVGDVKQSIYRFNNANPKIFIEKYNNYGLNKGGVKIDLNTNFRSRKEVISNINTIFSRVMTESIGGAEYARDHMMKSEAKGYVEDSKYNMQILNYHMEDYEEFGKQEVEAFIIANDIKKKYDEHFQIFDQDLEEYRDFTYSDAAILLSAKKEFELYKKVFDYFDIPLTVHKDEDLTYSTELVVIKNIIKLVGYYKGINLDNMLIKTYMSVARSFVLGLSDKEIFKTLLNAKNGNLFDYIDKSLLDKIVYLSEFIDDHSISELTQEVLNIFDIYLKIGTIGEKEIVSYKIEYLINIALSLEKNGYHLNEFISYLNDAGNEDINFKLESNKSMEIGVNIMSIHKSKGLDFKICYFADLERAFSIRELKSRYIFSKEYGLILPIIKEGVKSTILKELLKNEYRKEEISERIRLFYVALTRTKEQMIVVTSLDDKESSHVDIVPEDVRIKYKSFKSILESVKYYLNKYVIEAPKMELTRDYEKIKLKSSNNDEKDFKTININIKKKKLAENRYSHSINELEDSNLLDMGTKIHECLEYLDFNDFDNSLNKLDIDDYFKNKIRNIKNQPFITPNAIYHKEYEFIVNDNHGIIDLLIERDDKLIVVDYKLSEINKDYYFEQVKGYMNYLKMVSDKAIEGYLYSIIDGIYLKVE